MRINQIVLILFSLNTIINSFEFISVSISVTSFIINKQSNYTINIQRQYTSAFLSTPWNTQPVPANSNINIQFPTEYNLALNVPTCGNIILDSTVVTGFTCTVNGRNLTISNAILTNNTIAFATIDLNNVVNPWPALTTGSFVVFIGNDNSAQGISAQLAFQPANFVGCAIIFSPATVNTTGSMIFQLTTTNLIYQNGTFLVQFPTILKWQRDQSSTHLLPINGLLSCSNKTTNVLNNLSCIGQSSTATVTISNVFSSQIGASTILSFAINNLFSPPSLEPIDLMTITSFSNGFKIDTCTSVITSLQPNSFSQLTIAPTGTMLVNSMGGLVMSFIIPDTVTKQDTITIIFPNTSIFTLNNAASSHFTFLTRNYNSFMLNFTQTTSSAQINKTTKINITFITYKAPPSTQTIPAFTLQILKSGYLKMQGTAILSPALPKQYSISVSVIDPTVYKITDYNLLIILTDPLTSTGQIQITIPQQLGIQPNFTVSMTGTTNINSVPIYNFTSPLVLRLKSINQNSSSIPMGQNITITLKNIRNPTSVRLINLFTVNGFYNVQQNLVFQGQQSNNITFIPAVIQINSLNSSSYVTAENSTYYLNFTNINMISVSGKIVVNIPSSIKVFTLTTCSLQGLAVACTIIGQTIQIITPSQISAGTAIALQFNQFQNPLTTQPTTIFTISTYNSANQSIDVLSNGPQITMLTPRAYHTLLLSRTSSTNSAIVNYTFTISHLQQIQNNGVVRIKIPTKIQLPTILQCNGNNITLCTVNGSTVDIILSSVSQDKYTYILTLQNLKNYKSYANSGSFQVSTLTANKTYIYASDLSSINVVNNVPSTFTSLNYQFSNTILGELTNLTISIELLSASATYFVIELAPSFIISSIALSSSQFINLQFTVSGNIINITNASLFVPTMFSLKIQGIRTPNAQPVDFTKLSTYDDGFKLMSTSTNLIQLIVNCIFPCKTCSATNTSSCLSCYSPPISNKIFLYLNQCLNICPAKTYNDIVNNICPDCQAPCFQCANSAIYCTSCNTNTTFIYLNQTNSTSTCLSECPQKMYPDLTQVPNKCLDCVSPCSKCTTALKCISCVSGFYFNLINSQCTSVCPQNITITNNITTTCDPCSIQCAACQVIVSNCTSCSATAAVYNGSCVSVCPGNLIVFNSQCVSCDSSCKTCSILPTNCTTCDQNLTLKYFYQNNCLSGCPQFFYANFFDLCLSCQSANINCKNCSSVSICLACDTGYVLLNTSCLPTTPPGYLNISGIAVPCSGDCQTCFSVLTNCTSCKTLFLSGNTCVNPCPNNFIGISKICQPCNYPCLTCIQSQTKCLSCDISNNTLYFLNNNCYLNCPNTTYPNTVTNVCNICLPPCATCISQVDCISCATGFLQNTSCVASCINGYVGINKICQKCVSPCLTCSTSNTNCTSCQTNLYYNSITNTCLTQCPLNLIPDNFTFQCRRCLSPCQTCQNTTSTCKTCISNTYFLNNQCFNTCPNGYFAQINKCTLCSIPCQTCTSPTLCLSCISNLNSILYVYNNQCVSSCPITHSVIVNNTCTKCSVTQCSNCSNSDFCYTCNSPYIYFNSTCWANCPQNYQLNGQNCVKVAQTVQTVNNTLTQTLTEVAGIFPLPFTIVGCILSIACFMSKLQNNNTYVIGTMYAIFGILQCLSILYLLYNYYFKTYLVNQGEFLTLLLILIAIGIIYALNTIGLLVQSPILIIDKKFQTWISSCGNKIFFIFTSTLSFVINYKFKMMMFTKLFHFVCVRAQLQSLQKFRIFNILSFLGMGHEGLIIYVSLLTITKLTAFGALFYAFIDVIVIAVINIILALLCSWKPDDFFQQYEQGLTMNKKYDLQEDFIEKPTYIEEQHFSSENLNNYKQSASKNLQKIQGIDEDELDDELSLSISQKQEGYDSGRKKNIFETSNNRKIANNYTTQEETSQPFYRDQNQIVDNLMKTNVQEKSNEDSYIDRFSQRPSQYRSQSFLLNNQNKQERQSIGGSQQFYHNDLQKQQLAEQIRKEKHIQNMNANKHKKSIYSRQANFGSAVDGQSLQAKVLNKQKQLSSYRKNYIQNILTSPKKINGNNIQESAADFQAKLKMEERGIAEQQRVRLQKQMQLDLKMKQQQQKKSKFLQQKQLKQKEQQQKLHNQNEQQQIQKQQQLKQQRKRQIEQQQKKKQQQQRKILKQKNRKQQQRLKYQQQLRIKQQQQLRNLNRQIPDFEQNRSQSRHSMQNPLNQQYIDMRDMDIQSRHSGQDDQQIPQASIVKRTGNTPIISASKKFQSKIHQQIQQNHSINNNKNNQKQQKNSKNYASQNIPMDQSIYEADEHKLHTQKNVSKKSYNVIDDFLNFDQQSKGQSSNLEQKNNVIFQNKMDISGIESSNLHKVQSDQKNEVVQYFDDKQISASDEDKKDVDQNFTLPLQSKLKFNELNENKTKKNYQFSQVYEVYEDIPKKQQKQIGGLESSEPQEMQEINIHPIKSKVKSNKQALLQILQHSQKDKLIKQRAKNPHGTLPLQEPDYDFNKVNKKRSYNNEFSSQSINENNSKQLSQRNKPPRPYTTTKSKLYNAGLQQFDGQINNLNKKNRGNNNYPINRKNTSNEDEEDNYQPHPGKRNKSLHGKPFIKQNNDINSGIIEEIDFSNIDISPSKYDHKNQRYVTSTLYIDKSSNNNMPTKPIVQQTERSFTGREYGSRNQSRQQSKQQEEPSKPLRMISKTSQVNDDIRHYYQQSRSRSRSRSNSKDKNKKSQKKLKQLQKIYLQRLNVKK